MNVFSISCNSHPHDIFWTKKTQKLFCWNTISHCMGPKMVTYNHFWVPFGFFPKWSPSNPWRLRGLGTLVALAATKTWSRLRKTFNWMAVYIAWFRRAVFALAGCFFLLWDRLFFFFSELSAFNSLLKDMDCQNGRKQWSQHHDMSAQLVFVWCFFFQILG